MRGQSFRLWALAFAASAACRHVEGGQQAEVPRPGVPQQELALLEGTYSINASECTRTAEDVVDMQRRCSGARWADCVYAATMYAQGCGVAQDLARAEALYQRSCGFGSMVGCASAATVTKDVERSIALLEEPCARGYRYACGVLGAELFNRGKEADVARATDLLDKACREDRPVFCGALGTLVAQWKIEPRFAATRELLEQACRGQDPDSCHTLATALEDGSLGTVDYDRAAALNSATCHQLNHLPSCNSFGSMLMNGRGCEQNQWQGAWYFYQACNRGYGPACDSMGEATEKGWGGPASPSKALPFYDHACKLGSEHACKRAKELRADGSGIVEPTGR
jgi:TPR repeat protein